MKNLKTFSYKKLSQIFFQRLLKRTQFGNKFCKIIFQRNKIMVCQWNSKCTFTGDPCDYCNFTEDNGGKNEEDVKYMEHI